MLGIVLCGLYALPPEILSTILASRQFSSFTDKKIVSQKVHHYKK